MRRCLVVWAFVSVSLSSLTAEAQWPVKLEVEMRLLSRDTVIWGETQHSAIAIRNVDTKPLLLGPETQLVFGFFEMREKGGKWVQCELAGSSPGSNFQAGRPFRTGVIENPLRAAPRESGIYPGETYVTAMLEGYDFGLCFREMKDPLARIWAGKGDYEVRYVLTGPGQNMGMPASALVASKPVLIRKLAPQGIDKLAIEDRSLYANSNPRSYPEPLYEKYPTAIYVGHELMKESGGTALQYMQSPPGNVWQARLTPQSSEAIRVTYKQRDEHEVAKTQLRMRRIAIFLNARPEFIHANTLRLELAGRLAGFGKFDEAKVQFDAVMKSQPSLEHKKQLLEFEQAMVEKKKSLESAQGKDGGS